MKNVSQHIQGYKSFFSIHYKTVSRKMGRGDSYNKHQLNTKFEISKRVLQRQTSCTPA